MSHLCPACRSMLTPAEVAGGQCGSCDARFTASDLGPAVATGPVRAVATLVTPGPVQRPSTSDNPYAAPEANLVAATVAPAPGSPAVSPEYDKARKEAWQMLFGLAGLGGFVAAAMLVVAFFSDNQDLKFQMLAMGIEVGGIAVVFACLGFWSLAQPLPATVAGLLLYVLITLAAMALDPASAMRGIIIRVIIIGLLSKIVFALSKGPGA